MVVPGLKNLGLAGERTAERGVAARGEIGAWQAFGTLGRGPPPEVIPARAVMVRRRWWTGRIWFWALPLKGFSLTVYLRGRREMR